ncbi:MAG: hypothetical protein JJU29_03100 [Verrucomicrobia bacterium]|nr:hypothetical protein [Verrucomicrobiota bacterium]MCH8511161.1 hypothetical protein [Kiritimatiellia bacterium]
MHKPIPILTFLTSSAFTILAPLPLFAQVPGLYPDASGGHFGVELVRTKDEIKALETVDGVETDVTQTDENDYLVLRLGMVRNDEWYFKIGGGVGYSLDGKTQTRGESRFMGESISLDEDLGRDSGIYVNLGARLGYNYDISPTVRIRPVLGYKLEHKRYSTKRTFEFETREGPVSQTVGVDFEHTWLGYTLGIEGDMQIGESIVFAGIDYFGASPDLTVRGPAAMANGDASRSLDGDGFEFHIGMIRQFGGGTFFLRFFHQNWSGDGSGNLPSQLENGGEAGSGRYTWDVSNTGFMIGAGFGF